MVCQLFITDTFPDRGRAFQNVPFKTRRRAASHHRNRIPSSLRKFENAIEPVGKRPSKKYRKRRNEKERVEKRAKKCLHTHKWHAKRFHMTLIEEKWAVPLTSNEKCFRAVYRSVHQGAYAEDMSYWQCLEIQSDLQKVSESFGKVIVNSIEYPDLTKVEQEIEKNCWIYEKGGLLLGLIKIYVRLDRIWLWIHPKSVAKITEILNPVFAENLSIRPDLCRFRILGPQAMNNICKDFNVKALALAKILKLSDLTSCDFTEDQEILVVQVKGSRESGFGAGFDVIVHKDYAYKLWLAWTHNKVHIGCLDSQEQLDIEIGRLSSLRLNQDVL